MQIATNGIIANEYGQVLLIQRDDTRTWALPGGSLDAGESPIDGAAREVWEETGIKVLPVRLVGLYFWPMTPNGILIFSFRCLQKGGEIQTSTESLQVGYWPTHQLPSSMMHIHRERVEDAMAHTGGRPLWAEQSISIIHKIGMWFLRNGVYRYKDWQRKRKGEPPFTPPPSWDTGAFTVIRNENGEVLWGKRTDNGQWNLPGGGSRHMEPVWTTAVRETQEETGLTVKLTNLTGVYQFPEETHLKFVFTADIESGTLTKSAESAEFGWFAAGNEPENSYAAHRERVADAVSRAEQTVFKVQEKIKG